MNEIQRADPSQPEERAAAYRQALGRNVEATTPQWAARWTDVEITDGRPSPVFLVGFPRSGTTLLDTMLMGHPDVEVLEEEPTFHRAGEAFADYLRMPDASADVVAAARDAYFEDLAKRTPMAPGKLIVDKNPLLMGAVPLIHRMFPDAKIILAVRHPCDVALSCFTTNFKLNDGMSSFLRLDTTAELYDLAFTCFEKARAVLPVATHTVLYEKVVADREAELKALFEFLGLALGQPGPRSPDHRPQPRTDQDCELFAGDGADLFAVVRAVAQLPRPSRAHPAGAEAVDRDVRLRDLMASAAGLVEQADAATAAGNLQRAEELLVKASASASDDVSLYLKLAAIQRATGRSDAALATVHRALTVSPLDFTALLLRASLLDRMDQPGAPKPGATRSRKSRRVTCRRTCNRSSRQGKRASRSGPPRAKQG